MIGRMICPWGSSSPNGVLGYSSLHWQLCAWLGAWYIYILLLIIINYCYYYYIYIYTSSDDFELKQSMSTIHIHVDTNWIKLWIELPKQHTQNQPKLRALWCLHSNGYRHPNLSWTMSPCRFSLSLFVAKLNLNTYYTGILCMCNICWRLYVYIYIYTIIDIYVIHIINIMYIYNIESYNKYNML